MSDSKIASRYALSLYDKASETGVLESVATDIRSLNQVVTETEYRLNKATQAPPRREENSDEPKDSFRKASIS